MSTCKKIPQCQVKTGKRLVKPFSMSSYQKNTQVLPPLKINIYDIKGVNKSLFRILYLRGDIPCQQSFSRSPKGSTQSFLAWKVSSPQDLDYSYYLPIFFVGSCEDQFPYNMICRYAIHDLLNAGKEKVLPVVPKLMIPLKNALNTKNPDIIIAALRVIQHMCIIDCRIAEALIPYYRQILPIFNLFYDCKTSSRRIDYKRNGDLRDMIEETLSILEWNGGPDAYINIKYCIPTYESSVNN